MRSTSVADCPATIADHNAYWTDGLAPSPSTHSHIVSEADVVIIGAGYTGMHTAIVTANQGKTTQVLEAQTLGWGCSTRNGGQISSSIKPTQKQLTKNPATINIIDCGQLILDVYVRFAIERRCLIL